MRDLVFSFIVVVFVAQNFRTKWPPELFQKVGYCYSLVVVTIVDNTSIW